MGEAGVPLLLADDPAFVEAGGRNTTSAQLGSPITQITRPPDSLASGVSPLRSGNEETLGRRDSFQSMDNSLEGGDRSCGMRLARQSSSQSVLSSTSTRAPTTEDSWEVPRLSGKSAKFYKTNWCPWVGQGRCYAGSECNYAHCAAELRQKPDLRRTRLCNRFMQTGRCHVPDCSFAHGCDKLRRKGNNSKGPSVTGKMEGRQCHTTTTTSKNVFDLSPPIPTMSRPIRRMDEEQTPKGVVVNFLSGKEEPPPRRRGGGYLYSSARTVRFDLRGEEGPTRPGIGTEHDDLNPDHSKKDGTATRGGRQVHMVMPPPYSFPVTLVPNGPATLIFCPPLPPNPSVVDMHQMVAVGGVPPPVVIQALFGCFNQADLERGLSFHYAD